MPSCRDEFSGAGIGEGAICVLGEVGMDRFVRDVEKEWLVMNSYSSLNADVIGISIDTPFSQEAWAQKEKITTTLASDLNKEVIKQYDVVFPMLAGVGDTAARAAFVIDKNGVVQYSEQTPTPKDLPNFDKVKETLSKLG